MVPKKVDPVLLEVIANALQGVAEEMGVALVRASFSTNIKDRKDCSCGMFTANGELIAQAEHIPLHLGLLPSVVEAVGKYYPYSSLKPGDAIIINDPHISGSHLPDICIMAPIFYRNKLIAISCNLAHHSDVGGMSPGSLPAHATEIYQEGLRLPPLRIRKDGVLDNELLQIIMTNVRTPEEMHGDLMAQIAAANVGERRILELAEKYGVKDLDFYIHALLDSSEQRMLQNIKEMPKGTWDFVDYLEGDGTTDDNIPFKCTLTVADNEIIIDFTGSSPQIRGSSNCTRGVTLASCYYAVKTVVDNNAESNAGTFRPVQVITPPGTIVNPNPPAAVSNANGNSAQRVADVVLGAFVKCLPDKVPAAGTGSMNVMAIGGRTDEGESYAYVEAYGGGMGACNDLDGMDGTHVNMTNTLNAPVEVIETTVPVLINRYALIPGTSGAGEFRGGLGMTRELELLSEQAVVTISMDRRNIGPWGLAGGKPGGTSTCWFELPNGDIEHLPTKSTSPISCGTKVIFRTAGGGGYGDPIKRDLGLIAKDIAEGIITEEEAIRDYGYQPQERTKS